MVLHVNSDASYLNEPKSRGRVGGCSVLISISEDSSKQPKNKMDNGTVNIKCRVLRHVVVSSAEAELGALFHNGQTTIPLCTTLVELVHQQPPTPIETDNYTALGIANSTSNPKKNQLTYDSIG